MYCSFIYDPIVFPLVSHLQPILTKVDAGFFFSFPLVDTHMHFWGCSIRNGINGKRVVHITLP